MFIHILIIAWVLSWFGFDHLFITAVKELFNLNITDASYYFIFFIGGLVLDGLNILFHLKTK